MLGEGFKILDRMVRNCLPVQETLRKDPKKQAWKFVGEPCSRGKGPEVRGCSGPSVITQGNPVAP